MPTRRPDRVVGAVLAVTALALAVRLVDLGARPLHWSEARVGYWALRFLETGTYSYRPVAGGPFLYVVDRWVFALVGTSDAAARLAVAVVGGLLPLAALLFRQPHATTASDEGGGRPPGLDDAETVAFAALLALTPPLVYYARFLRGDLPLAAFGLVAVGCWHRARSRGRRGPLYAGGLALGLALTTSALWPVLLTCWAVAALLTFDEGRVRGLPSRVLLARARSRLAGLRDWATPIARTALLAVGVVVAFYVPRGVVDLSTPGSVAAALYAGSAGALTDYVEVLMLGRHAPPTLYNDHPLVPYLRAHAATLLATALPVVALGAYGFLRERYAGRWRPVAAFGAYWAGASLLLVPTAAELFGPWLTVHTLVPLSLPAAVGLTAVGRRSGRAFARGDAARVAATLLLVAAGGLHVGVVATDVYDAPDDDTALAQFAQPRAELRPAMADATAVVDTGAGEGEAVDVLFVGERFAVADESVLSSPPVPPAAQDAFAARLPLSWYFERADAETASVAGPDSLGDAPPVVVTAPGSRAALAERLDGYRAYRVHLALTDRTVVVFVDEEPD